MPSTTTETKRITLRCQFCLTWNRIDAARAADRPKCAKCAKPMLLDRPIVVTDETFQRTVTSSEIPVLMDFYADWCGPCKVMAPAVDELARKVQGRALVAKLNTDASPRTSEQFQIRSIPTTVVFQDGKEVARQSGALPLVTLESMLASHIAHS